MFELFLPFSTTLAWPGGVRRMGTIKQPPWESVCFSRHLNTYKTLACWHLNKLCLFIFHLFPGAHRVWENWSWCLCKFSNQTGWLPNILNNYKKISNLIVQLLYGLLMCPFISIHLERTWLNGKNKYLWSHWAKHIPDVRPMKLHLGQV